ncbi:hypothetical protein GCM10011512_20460 [Tersicoccus solisilvae]|uniref:DUF1461 domain-containing protein n=1 Tax=Tersicoccus solisilvae TaxID=1882339 RepID=A0ABQ1PA25_9MICC|nr:hypothetical protein [Tersicoccus solisilvae]GGC93334.1 hypothetical protein GCM10011512_20460 [Tersicoccus solisilvae]
MTDDVGDADRPASPSAQQPSRQRAGRRPLPWPRLVTALVGLGLLVAGIVTMVVTNAGAITGAGPARYAEYTVSDEPAVLYSGSYESLQPGDWVPGSGPADLVGPLLILAGAVVLVFTVGWALAQHAVAAKARPVRELLAGAGIAVVLVVAGFAVGLMAAPQRSFGWFAYAPLSDEYFAPAVPDASVLFSLALVTAGLGVLVVTAGWWFGWIVGTGAGRRQPRRSWTPGPDAGIA